MKNKTVVFVLAALILAAGFVGGLIFRSLPGQSVSAQDSQTEYTLADVFTAWLTSKQVCTTSSDFDSAGKFVETTECVYEVPDWFNPFPTPVPTEPPVKTPTQDITQFPTDTPGTPPPTKEEETPTPIPIDKTCTIVNNLTTAINMRSEPVVADNKVGSWSPGVQLIASEFYVSGLFRWAKVGVNAWVAVYQDQWWITSNDCTQVKGWSSIWTNPPPITTQTQTLSGAHASAPISFQTQQDICNSPNIKIIKTITLAGDLLRIIKQCRPDVITIFRVTDPECPTRDEVYNNPILYADRLRTAFAHWGPESQYVDYYEVMNECAGFSGEEDYQALAQFFIQVADYLNRTGGMCILAGGFGPGNPLVSDFVELYPYFKWSEEHPCGANKYHGVSSHSSVCPPFPTPDYPWNCWEWIFGRHLIYNASLKGKYGYDLLNSDLPYIITEAGIVYGFAEEDPFTAQQKKLAVMNSLCLWQQDGVDGFVWWNICGGDNCWGWLNDSDNLTTMFSWTQAEYDFFKNTNQICKYP